MDIGIEFTTNHKGYKILLTSRHRHVCSAMKCNTEVQLDVMSETEAWELFKERAGLNDVSAIIDIDMATKVAKECKGLPIAIVTLGRALTNNSPSQWKAALMCLKESRLVDIETIEDVNAYKCLKVSYDKLNGDEIKLCFLLCSLFPEDHDIEIELLARHVWGLGIYEAADSIEEVRIKVQSSTDHLKDYCLLLETRANKVKMHDVVRHFALWMASNKDSFFPASCIERSKKLTITKSIQVCMAISLIVKGIKELPSGLVRQNLRILLIDGDDATRVSATFFEHMRALEVLTISRCQLSLHVSDISINLRALHLEFCKVSNIFSLGNLKKLEILSFQGSEIHELPNAVSEMKDLKLLDLSGCRKLERIPPGLLEKLSRLEELYVTGSLFNPWDARPADTESRSKASLSELNSLLDLKVLSLEYKVESLPYNFVMPNLTRYEISHSGQLYTRRQWISGHFPNSKKLQTNVLNDTSCNAFKKIFPAVDHLSVGSVDGMLCIVPEIDPGGFNSLISLSLWSSREMLCLIDTTGQNVPTTAFCNLKKLTLSEMDNLREVCRGQIQKGFLQKIETLLLYHCPKLCSIFQLDETRKTEDSMPFSSLLELKLYDLPELSCLWKGPTQHVSLNSLTTVEIDKCDKLSYIFSPSMAQTLANLQSLQISLCHELEDIFKEEDNGEEASTSQGHSIFTRLVHVAIKNCNKLEHVFPTFVAPSCLQKLQKLHLEDNAALERIFNYGNGSQRDIELSHLENLTIQGSPKLKSFTRGYCFIYSFPSLQYLFIRDCAIRYPPRLEAKQLQQVHLYNIPKGWWHNYLSQLIGDLPNLASLILDSIQGVDEVIRLEADPKISNLLLSMQSLTLHKLPELVHIWKCPSYTRVLLKNLTRLSISSCNKLSFIFLPTLAQNLPVLKLLKVEDCNELVQIIGNGEEVDRSCIKLTSFPSLERIEIRNCNKIIFVFPVSVVHGLPRLWRLDVQGADALEYVFGNEALKEEKNKVEVVLGLKRLLLDGLPSLRGFSVAGYNYLFPLIKSLTCAKVEGCPNMTKTFSLSPSDGYLHI